MNKYAQLYLQKIASDVEKEMREMLSGMRSSLADVGNYNPAINVPTPVNASKPTNVPKAPRILPHSAIARGLSNSGNNVSAVQKPSVTNAAQHSAIAKGYSAAPNGVQVVPNAKMIMPSQKQMKLDSDASLVNYASGGVLDTPSINPSAPTPSPTPAKGVVPPINKQVMEQGLRSGKYKLLDDKGNPVEIPPLY